MFSKKAIKEHKWIVFIILAFLALKIATLHLYREAWWDPSVYIGMGKYIFSLGSAGFWEDARPIGWPLMLGFLWKIGINPIFFGRILDVIFGALAVYLTYRIGDEIFGRKTALTASVFMAFSPTFFFFTGIMITETVSTFFALLALYFFITKRNFLSGLFFGIAFMTRFLQIFAFIAATAYILISQKNRNKTLSKLFLGFAIAIIPYLALNAFLYSNSFYPFIYHADLTKNSGWDNYHGISFYFNSLFKENIFYLLSIIGAAFAFKNNNKGRLIALPLAIFSIFFISIKQKEMRFLIILMPYMYLLVSSSLTRIFNTKKPNMLLMLLIIMTIALSSAGTLDYYKSESSRINQYSQLQESYGNSKGSLWISGPMIAVYSDNKASNLMYYPYFDSIKKQEMENSADNADYIFIDSCDIGCRPNDNECESKKEELWSYFASKLATVYSSKHDKCIQYIFKK